MSTQITTEMLKELRDATGISVMQCKKALEEAEGSMEKALMILKKKSSDIAAKKADRTAADGLIVIKKGDGKAVMTILNCETDFVARNEIFTGLVKDLAMHIAASAPLYVSIDEVPATDRKKIEVEFTEKTKAEGKPADMVDKIVEGQLKKYFAERCLMDQPFVKDPDITVAAHVKQNAALMNENVVVRRFSRIALGEVA